MNRLLVIASLSLVFGCSGASENTPETAMPRETGAAVQAVENQADAAAAGNQPIAEQIGAQAAAQRNADKLGGDSVGKTVPAKRKPASASEND